MVLQVLKEKKRRHSHVVSFKEMVCLLLYALFVLYLVVLSFLACHSTTNNCESIKSKILLSVSNCGIGTEWRRPGWDGGVEQQAPHRHERATWRSSLRSPQRLRALQTVRFQEKRSRPPNLFPNDIIFERSVFLHVNKYIHKIENGMVFWIICLSEYQFFFQFNINIYIRKVHRYLKICNNPNRYN